MPAGYGASSPVASEVSFDNTGTTVTATNMQDAIAELSLGSGSSNDFLVHKTAENESVQIKENRTLLAIGLEIDGFLDITGGLVFI